MTIRSISKLSLSGGTNTGARQFLYQLLDFMRTAPPNGPGWSIPASSDGSTLDTGGAGANMTGSGDLNNFVASTSRSWFVLRSPDGSREIMFFRATTSAQRWDVQRPSAGGLFTYGSETLYILPTGGNGVNGNNVFITESGPQSMHITADDAAPYGWCAFSHNGGLPDTEHGICCEVPMDSGTDPADVDPIVFYSSSSWASLTNISNAFNNNRANAHHFSAAPGFNTCSASKPTGFPNEQQLNSLGEDVSFPIPWARRSTDSMPNGFKGISSFMQWNGPARSGLELFANLTRISFGDVNVPWDGVTIPVP